MGANQSQTIMSRLLTNSAEIEIAKLHDDEREEYIDLLIQVKNAQNKAKGLNNSLSPPLQCLFNDVNFIRPPLYTHVSGVHIYVVLKHKKWNRWVWLLGEYHQKFELCEQSESRHIINILDLLQNHYTTTPGFLDVFYEDNDLKLLVEANRRYDQKLMENEDKLFNRQDDTSEKVEETDDENGPYGSFMRDETYGRRNCIYYHNSTEKSPNCPSNVRFHWIDARTIMGANIMNNEDFEQWKHVVNYLLYKKNNNPVLSLSAKLALFLFDFVRESSYFTKIKHILNRKEKRIKSLIDACVSTYDEQTLMFDVHELSNYTSRPFDELSYEEKHNGLQIYGGLLAGVQDLYTLARMHKQYNTDDVLEPSFTKNCIFYGGMGHVHNLVSMLTVMGYKELQWSRGELDGELMCVPVRHLSQPLFHRFRT